VRAADAYVKGKQAGREEVLSQRPPDVTIDVSKLPTSSQKQVEIAIRQERRKLESELKAHVATENLRIAKMISEFELRVETEIERRVQERIIPLWENNRAYLKKMRDAHRGLMTKQEYNLITSCLHPDSRASVSPDRLAEAFRLWKDKEVPLLPVGPLVNPLPDNLADLLRARKEAEAAKREARNARKQQH
jgi:hypothetical protein